MFRRPLLPQLDRYCPAEERTASQLAQLGTQRPIPRGLIGPGSPIAIQATIATDFTADGRCRSSQLPSNRTQRTSRAEPSGNLLPFKKAERLPGSSPSWRTKCRLLARSPKRPKRIPGQIGVRLNSSARQPAGDPSSGMVAGAAEVELRASEFNKRSHCRLPTLRFGWIWKPH